MEALEATMPKKLSTPNNGKVKQFPPEANGDFDVVSTETIAVWREKLSKKFGIGTGKLEVLEEPSNAS